MSAQSGAKRSDRPCSLVAYIVTGLVLLIGAERLLSSFRTRSRDPSPTRFDRLSGGSPGAMPDRQAFQGPPTPSATLNTDAPGHAGMMGAGVLALNDTEALDRSRGHSTYVCKCWL